MTTSTGRLFLWTTVIGKYEYFSQSLRQCGAQGRKVSWFSWVFRQSVFSGSSDTQSLPFQVRLGDTSLILEVERDHTVYGDECKFGGGKVLREGMGQAAARAARDSLDTVITNALVVDAVTGIVKADVGIKVRRGRGNE